MTPQRLITLVLVFAIVEIVTIGVLISTCHGEERCDTLWRPHVTQHTATLDSLERRWDSLRLSECDKESLRRGYASLRYIEAITDYAIKPRLLLYGVSSEPMMPTDTVTGTYHRSGDKMYIKAADGRNIFAAWVMEIKPKGK